MIRIIIALVVVWALITILQGCGRHVHHTPRHKTLQSCTVNKSGADAFIFCPDGSSAVVKAKVRTIKDTETIVVVEECTNINTTIKNVDNNKNTNSNKNTNRN